MSFVFLLMVIGFIYMSGYRKVPPDMAMLVYRMKLGRGFVLKDILTGGGKFIIPVFQRTDFLLLDVRTLEMSAEDVVCDKSGSRIEIDIKAVTQIKACTDPEGLRNAVEHQLGLSPEDVNAMGLRILEKHTRLIALGRKVMWVFLDRDGFNEGVKQNALKDMRSKGLEVRNFIVKEIDSKSGVLDAVGRIRTEEIKRGAGGNPVDGRDYHPGRPNPQFALVMYQAARSRVEKGLNPYRYIRVASFFDPENVEYISEYMRAVGEPVTADSLTPEGREEFILRREREIHDAWEEHYQGKTLMEAGRFREAEDHFRRAMEIDPFEDSHRLEYHVCLR
ncbi:MAG: SPFH domain-containing protein [Thermoplasmatota archaeon]